MKILLFSDTHGNLKGPLEVLRREPGVDRFFHMGDTYYDAVRIRDRSGVPMTAVKGNMDGGSEGPALEVVGLEGVRFMLVHGDRYHVTRDIAVLDYEAESRDVQVVCFGHTHKPFDHAFNGRRYLNPGAFSHGRAFYGVLTVEDGTVEYRQVKGG